MYTIIDIEGNGGAYREEKIIEVAIYKYDGHQIIDQFISLVNPEDNITPFVQKLTNISPKMVRTAPKFHEIAKRIVEITKDTTLVGHNIDFDYRMLRQEFKKLGYNFQIHTLDTIPLAKKLIPDAESFSLGKLVNSLGIPLTNQHRASGDARATLELFKILINKDHSKEILKAQQESLKSNYLHNRIVKLTEKLPSKKGIIYFQNPKGDILHSEYTDNIHKLAKKMLTAKSVIAKKIQTEVSQIHYEEVGNEIVATVILHQKNLYQNPKSNSGLFYSNGAYFIQKIKKNNTEYLLKFNSYTQGLKVARYLNENKKLVDLQNFKELISIEDRPQLWLCEGRTLAEKAFFLLEKKVIIGYGFYDYFHQIQKLSTLDNLKISTHIPISKIENQLKRALLQNQFTFQELPKN